MSALIGEHSLLTVLAITLAKGVGDLGRLQRGGGVRLAYGLRTA
jgi:hypothetical protein